MTFADELRKAMTTRGVTALRLAEDIGVSASAIADWKGGRRTPTRENGNALAEALHWPALAAMVTKARTRTCPVCAASFVIGSKATTHGEYCSKTCRSAAAYRRLYGRVQQDGQVARNRLTLHQEAVRAFCLACTARTLVCEQPKCELRPVSPARLAMRRAA